MNSCKMSWMPHEYLNYNIAYFCVSSWVLAFTIYSGEMNVLAVKPTYNRTKTSCEWASRCIVKAICITCKCSSRQSIEATLFPKPVLVSVIWWKEYCSVWYGSNEGGLNSFEKWSQATFSFVQLPVLNNTAYIKLDCIIRAVLQLLT